MVALSLGLFAIDAPAQTAGSAQAEALFQEGKALLDKKQYAQACPKLEASYKADAATGTLLALAFCHEQEGRIATAWAEYLDTAARAKAEKRADREKKARDRAAALAPRLSRLTIQVDPSLSSLPGFRVTRNAAVVEPGAWNTALPVDPGDHTIEVSATARRTWRTQVQVVKEAESRIVSVPALQQEGGDAPIGPVASAPVAPASSTSAAAAAPTAPPSTAAPTHERSALPVVGLVVGGLGVVGVGIGTWFGFKAKSKNDDSSSDCSGNQCGPVGTQARNDALDAAKISTVGFVAGLALIGVGTTLYLIAPNPKRSAEVTATAGPGQMGLGIQGRF